MNTQSTPCQCPACKPVAVNPEPSLPLEKMPHVGEEFRRDARNRIFRIRVVVRPWPELTAWARADGAHWAGPGPLNVQALAEPGPVSPWVPCDIMVHGKLLARRERHRRYDDCRFLDQVSVRPVPSCACPRWTFPGEPTRFVAHHCREANREFDLLAAQEAVLNSIPTKVLNSPIVRRCAAANVPLELLRACVTHYREARDLACSNHPLLIVYGLRRLFLPADHPDRWASHADWLGLKQREICGRLGFPATQQMVHVFRTLRPRWMRRELLVQLHQIAQRPELLDILSNPPVRDGKELLSEDIVSDLAELRGLMIPAFLRRYLAVPTGSANRIRIWREARELRRRLDELGRADWEPHVSGERAMRELLADSERELESAGHRNPEAGSKSAQWLPGFPSAPIAEQVNIRHLDTEAALRAEGALMGHCVGRCAHQVQRDARHFYAVHAPERVTVSVVPRGLGWEVEEIRGEGNAAPQAETVQLLREWVATAPQRTVPTSRNKDAAPRVGLAPHIRLVTAGTESDRGAVGWLRGRYQWREHAPHHEWENDGHNWSAPLHSALSEINATSHTIRYEWNPLWRGARFGNWWEVRDGRLINRRLSQAA